MRQRIYANIIWAVLGGAAASAGITTGLLLMINCLSGSARLGDFLAAHLAWFGLTFAANALVASTLGLAWHSHASKRGWRRAGAYWAPGALVGLLIPAVIFLSAFDAPGLMAILASYGGFLGGLTGVFAWLIRRPDRSAPT